VTGHIERDFREVTLGTSLGVEDLNTLLLNEFELSIFVGSDAEVSHISSQLHAVQMRVLGKLAGEIGKGHTVGISGRRSHWCVGINMRIKPKNFSIWPGLLHASNRANSLGVVSSENDGVVAVLKSLVGLLLEG
jgi:hypothetical protein